MFQRKKMVLKKCIHTHSEKLWGTFCWPRIWKFGTEQGFTAHLKEKIRKSLFKILCQFIMWQTPAFLWDKKYILRPWHIFALSKKLYMITYCLTLLFYINFNLLLFAVPEINCLDRQKDNKAILQEFCFFVWGTEPLNLSSYLYLTQ